eukprot:1196235-Prorocentrum_minimum.AAC.3
MACGLMTVHTPACLSACVCIPSFLHNAVQTNTSKRSMPSAYSVVDGVPPGPRRGQGVLGGSEGKNIQEGYFRCDMPPTPLKSKRGNSGYFES